MAYKQILINRFDRGVSIGRHVRGGIVAVAKHFDLTTFPNKIVPYRGLAANTAGQFRIGNILIGSNGIPYGVGTVSGSDSDGQLYDKATIAADWAAMSFDGDTDALGSYRTLFEFGGYIYRTYGTKSGGAYNDGSAAGLLWVDFADGAGSTQAFANGKDTVSNGVVHPKTGYAYVGHGNLIAQINSVGGTYLDNALTLPSNAAITCITPFGNYLAIAARVGSSTFAQSKVFLWDVVNANSTVWDEVIDWPGDLQVIRTYYGYLIGVSSLGNTSYTLDRSGIQVYSYTLGGTPQKVVEFSTERQTTTAPSAQVNPNVNFIFNDKFYFSADVVGGSTSPKYYGLWSLSRSPIDGGFCVTIEQGATSDNSETSVLAAAKLADYAWFVHTANGTVTRIIDASDGDFSSTTFDCTSFLETVVNPGMDEADYEKLKTVSKIRINANFPHSTSQIKVYYRKDNATTWGTALITKTPSSPNTDNAGFQLTQQLAQARYYEFRVESIGGAELVGFSYEYTVDSD